jgi:hypothetical protein
VDGIYASVGITALFLADKWQKPGPFGKNADFKLSLKDCCMPWCTNGKLTWETHSLKWDISHYHITAFSYRQEIQSNNTKMKENARVFSVNLTAK